MISIVIPNWNGKGFLEKCLPSIAGQAFRNFEVIVVDNGSTDGSVGFVKDSYPEAVLVLFDANKGFSSAVNAGIKKARGEYVFLLNNDTEVDKDCLIELAAALDESPDVYFCATKMLFMDERDVINDAGDIFSIYGIAHQRGKGEKDNGRFDKREMVFGACAGAAIYRRELFDKVGLFDESFFAYLEDIDLSFRAQSAGLKCMYVPSAVVYHFDGGTSRRMSDMSRFLTVRNSIYVIIKDWPSILILRYLPFLLLGQARNMFMGLKHNVLPSIVRAYADVFKNFAYLMQERKRIQQSRTVPSGHIAGILSKEYPFSIIKSFFG